MMPTIDQTKLRAVRCDPGLDRVEVQIDNSLPAMQDVVGGNLELFNNYAPSTSGRTWAVGATVRPMRS
jgi:hypothetical protein